MNINLSGLLAALAPAIVNYSVHQTLGTANGDAVEPIVDGIASVALPGYVPIPQTVEVTPAQIAAVIQASVPHIENLVDNAVDPLIASFPAEQQTEIRAAINASIAAGIAAIGKPVA